MYLYGVSNLMATVWTGIPWFSTSSTACRLNSVVNVLRDILFPPLLEFSYLSVYFIITTPQPLSTSLLNSQMVNSQNNDGNLIGSTGSISLGGMIDIGGEDQGIKEIDVTLDGKTIIQVVVLSISLTSLAAFVSMRKITSMNLLKY